MEPRLYADLAPWWPLLSRPEDYAEEAAVFRHALDATSSRPIETLLELGCGGGNNASHLRRHYRLTLVDRSPGMLAVSRRLNPGCEHALGDMRTVRLGRTFDAVFVQDAIAYMTTEADLRAAVTTAAAHLRPGGVLLLVPDHTRETWEPTTDHGGHDGEGRSLRYLEWSYDPDPSDTWFTTMFVYLLREGDGPVVCVPDEHRMGLFPRATWIEAVEAAGLSPTALPFRHSTFAPDAGAELFLGVRP